MMVRPWPAELAGVDATGAWCDGESETTIMSETVTLYGVICTDNDEMTTWHSAHATEAQAFAAGAKLAHELWERDREGEPFPDVDNDADAMDVARGELGVRLEMEPIEVSPAVLRAALAGS
jgi:hypothetical protein